MPKAARILAKGAQAVLTCEHIDSIQRVLYRFVYINASSYSIFLPLKASAFKLVVNTLLALVKPQ